MSGVRVTAHAVSRYRERVAAVSYEGARQALSSPFIVQAANIGASFVKLATGQHVALQDRTVTTVLPKDAWPITLSRRYGE